MNVSLFFLCTCTCRLTDIQKAPCGWCLSKVRHYFFGNNYCSRDRQFLSILLKTLACAVRQVLFARGGDSNKEVSFGPMEDMQMTRGRDVKINDCSARTRSWPRLCSVLQHPLGRVLCFEFRLRQVVFSRLITLNIRRMLNAAGRVVDTATKDHLAKDSQKEQ